MRPKFLTFVLLLASVGCASKPKPPLTAAPPAGAPGQVAAQPAAAQAPAAQQAAEEKPSLTQRFFASFPHPGDGARRMPVDDDKRDKDNDF